MSDDPAPPAIALYDRFTHEGMDRRAFMARADPARRQRRRGLRPARLDRRRPRRRGADPGSRQPHPSAADELAASAAAGR